ncbi:fimbrial protein [Enterobacter cloacae]|uniref:fimbrial protein n=1 Tax=Enterobacter cloacae TaxID=550 RepID=UPI000E2E7466|nr:fimbrial protein [Enterobacter cloacae]
MMKKLALLVCLAAGGLMGSPAFADIPGSCWPIGGATVFPISKNLTAENIPGSVQEGWDNNQNFSGICSCKNSSVRESVFFKFTSDVLKSGSGKRNGEFIYYPFDEEKGIDIGFRIDIGGTIQNQATVDLQNLSGVDNQNITNLDCDDVNEEHPFKTGSSGTVSVKLTKKITGHHVYPAQELLTVYARKKSGDFDPTKPFVKLRFEMSITIPPNCTINGGEPINIPFGDIPANEFTPEANSKQKSIPLNVTCDDEADVSKANIKFRTSDFNDAGFIRTRNKEGGDRNDLGIKLEHNGNKIDGSSSAIPTQEGNVTIVATPVQQGEKSPEPGKFEATSTLDFEFK